MFYYFFKFKTIIILLLITLILIELIYLKSNGYLDNNSELNYNRKFSIMIRKNISTSGLMEYYYYGIGCVFEQIKKGFIPIMDLSSHPNVFNGYINNSKINPWEIFFNQPFGYSLKNIIKKAKYISYVYCRISRPAPNFNVMSNPNLAKYWKNIANKYIPIKEEFYNEANFKYKYLFKGTNNVLGILIRGTDYIANRPAGHPKQPTPEMVFRDLEEMNLKYKYNYFFLTTEDDLIRKKFISKYKDKLKYIKSKINLNYNYKKKQFLALNNNLKGNIIYMKIYLINIIILSKCLDIITSKTGGSLVTFIISRGFRNIKIYSLGIY